VQLKTEKFTDQLRFQRISSHNAQLDKLPQQRPLPRIYLLGINYDDFVQRFALKRHFRLCSTHSTSNLHHHRRPNLLRFSTLNEFQSQDVSAVEFTGTQQLHYSSTTALCQIFYEKTTILRCPINTNDPIRLSLRTINFSPFDRTILQLIKYNIINLFCRRAFTTH